MKIAILFCLNFSTISYGMALEAKTPGDRLQEVNLEKEEYCTTHKIAADNRRCDLVKRKVTKGGKNVGEEMAMAFKSKEETGNGLSLIDHEEFNKGRPPGFYRLAKDLKPSICQPLLKALNKAHPPSAQPYDSDSFMLMGSEFSVSWTKLKHHPALGPIWRSELDLNNDGREDFLYRQTGYMGKAYYHELAWVNSLPSNEDSISLERGNEIRGKKLAEGPWKGSSSNIVFFLDSGKNQNIQPSLPKDIKLPWGRIYEIVKVKDRYYVLLSDSKYWDQPLNLFVFQTQAKRDHSLMCLYASNYIIQSAKPSS